MPVPRELLISKLRSEFRRFFRNHGREFPWRPYGTGPFGTLIAEMLLRQTRGVQVAEVWPRLIAKYPDPKSLASASEDDVYEIVAPLGLGRQRAQALVETSAALATKHRGRVPRKVEVLLALPNVGLYAAHATACFAFGQRVPVVDVNVLRVLGRLFGEKFKPDNRRSPKAWELATEILPTSASAREHNYGLLDFASLICTTGKPLCRKCPLNGECTWCHEHVWSKVDWSQKPPPTPPWPR